MKIKALKKYLISFISIKNYLFGHELIKTGDKNLD